MSKLLTERELEVLNLICQGLSDAEIAKNLMIAPSTAKTHAVNILNKSGAHNRINLILWAFKTQQIPYPNTTAS